MRECIINGSMELIKKSNSDYDDEKLEVLEYGLTGLYIFISKSIIIFSISFLLGIFTELLIFMLIYNAIRLFSFGMHATSSTKCLVASALAFLTATFISKYVIIPSLIKLIIGIVGILMMLIYSPADTEKRPIISSKWRLTYKILSTVIACIMCICSLLNSSFIANACSLSIVIQCFMISPFSYRLTNQKYNNYKDYI